MELTEFSNYFFGSNLFAALLTSAVTVGVGLLAFVIYNKQNSDKKKDAASIVLLEIKNAETHLALAKEVMVRDKVLPESTFAMKTSSWQKYSYLFVRDFTAEEWNLINTFYEKCRLYDEAVDYNNTLYKRMKSKFVSIYILDCLSILGCILKD